MKIYISQRKLQGCAERVSLLVVSSARGTRRPLERPRGDDAAFLSNQPRESTGSSIVLQLVGYFFRSSTLSTSSFDTLSAHTAKIKISALPILILVMLNSRLADNSITSSCLLHSHIIDYESPEARLSSSLASEICLRVLYRRSELDPQRLSHLPPWSPLIIGPPRICSTAMNGNVLGTPYIHIRGVAVEPNLFYI